MHRRSAAVLLVLPLLGLAACGDSEPATPTGVLSKTEYLKQSEAACQRANAAGDALDKDQSTDPKAIAKAFAGAVKAADTAAAALTRLQPPKADAAQVKAKFIDPLNATVKAADTANAQVQKNATAGKTNVFEGVAVPDAPKLDSAFLTGYGFAECNRFVSSS